MTTKLHVAVDRQGSTLKLLVTAGQCGDVSQAERLLPGSKPGTVDPVTANGVLQYGWPSYDVEHDIRDLKVSLSLENLRCRRVEIMK